MQHITRYPGSKPFTIEYRDLFFGRDIDIENLRKFIEVSRISVLYGKSGLGKSSIINAGLLPTLVETPFIQHLNIRLGSFTENSQLSPVEIFIEKIKEVNNQQTFLYAIENEDITLWQVIKNLQLKTPAKKVFFIVLDQFEELFTYPNGVEEFGEQIADVINNKMPRSFRRKFLRTMHTQPDFFNEERLENIDREIDVKILISIRSDKLNLLNRLTNFLPDIFRNCYELMPLTREQAAQAILTPASLVKNIFSTPVFEYSGLALEKILDYLSQFNSKGIESFQLQILCQFIEQSIVMRNKETKIFETNLGDLEKVYENYYENLVELIEDEEDRTKARVLIEEGMIFEEEERRLSLYEGQIYRNFKVPKKLLEKLVDSHLLRAEPNTSGGLSYEISHDTLVPPILKAKAKRKIIEKETKEAVEKAEKLRKEKEDAEKQQKIHYDREKLFRNSTIVVLICLIVCVSFLGLLWDKYTQMSDYIGITVSNRTIKMQNQIDTLRLVQKETASILSPFLEDKFHEIDINFRINIERYIKLGDSQSALVTARSMAEFFSTLNATNPRRASAYSMLAISLMYNGKYTEAKQIYKQWGRKVCNERYPFFKDMFKEDLRYFENRGMKNAHFEAAKEFLE